MLWLWGCKTSGVPAGAAGGGARGAGEERLFLAKPMFLLRRQANVGERSGSE